MEVCVKLSGKSKDLEESTKENDEGDKILPCRLPVIQSLQTFLSQGFRKH